MHLKLFSGMENMDVTKSKMVVPFFITFFIMGERPSLEFGAVESLRGQRKWIFTYETVSIRKAIKYQLQGF